MCLGLRWIQGMSVLARTYLSLCALFSAQRFLLFQIQSHFLLPACEVGAH